MSVADAAARGGAVTLAGQLLRFGVQAIGIFVLARLIDPADFGVFAMVVAVVGIATVVGDFGLSMAAVQSRTITHQQRSNLFWTNSLLGAGLCLAGVLGAPALADFYGNEDVDPIMRMLSLTLFLSAVTAQFRAELSVQMRFGWIAAADVAAAAVALASAIIIALQGGGTWALVGQQIALVVVPVLILPLAARWVPGRPRRDEGMGALYRYGANTLGVQLFSYATSNVDSILIGRVWGAAPLGAYDRAYQLFRLPMTQIAAPMTRVALPVLSRVQTDERFTAYVHKGQLILAYCFGGMFLLLAAVADPLTELVLGPGWDAVVPIFAVLAVGGVFQGIGFVYHWVFLSLALTGLQLRWTLIGRSAMVAMMVVGVAFGPVGVAVGSTVGQVVMWALTTRFPLRRTGIAAAPLLRIAGRPLLLFAPVSAVCFTLSATLLSSWSALGQLSVLVGIFASWLALCLAVWPGVRADLHQLGNVLRRIRYR
ncbi:MULTISPECIES: lipopolysaccharide biosynthesis protein [unclassified Microbacterium]|uniref:lipopolysaccharide biosynthesis protein n=1 Tax=unclassified Microbacterium TaxID=2609290 RepID=UPI00214C6E12|nr:MULTISPECIES: lipopolysaccharide biosynthesis protein [unclassified Microbacterium]MCR2800531.1 lipopolysaccharide biosynthesis protein [Microbacterium sp. zg.Y818]MCR2825903.1 lipopolysaccharide biosynthesis protein [Microbacterium sp. zg.Y909]WIM22486.1 lipopolysaccharide biosynthesis protein [Microbacterium sp. zg-Y818]